MLRYPVLRGFQSSKHVSYLNITKLPRKRLSNVITVRNCSCFSDLRRLSSSVEEKDGRACNQSRRYHDYRDQSFAVVGASPDTGSIQQSRIFDGIVLVGSESRDGLSATAHSTRELSFKDKLDTCKQFKEILTLVNSWTPVLTVEDAATALQRLGQMNQKSENPKRKNLLLESPAFQILCSSLMAKDLSVELLVKSLKGVTALHIYQKHELTEFLCHTAEKRLHEKKLSVGEISMLCSPMRKIQGTRSTFLQHGLEEIEAFHSDIQCADIPLVLKAISLNDTQQIPKQLMSHVSDSIQRLAPSMAKSELSRTLHYLTVLDHENLKCLFLLSKRCRKFVKEFTESELGQVMRSLVFFRVGDANLLKVLEAEIPGRIPELSSETLARIMQYFGSNRYLSVPFFDTVSRYFVDNTERFTTAQLTQVMLPFGRLNYEPINAGEVFEKIEETLNYRWYEFKALDVLDLLHCCVLLGRFPLNFIHKIVSAHFLQKLEGSGTSVDFYVKSRLTQIIMALHLECHSYRLPKLPQKYQTRNLNRAFDLDALETKPMLMIHHVQRQLAELLGGDNHFAFWVQTPYIYHIDIQIKLDKDGCILPANQQEGVHTLIALCLTEMSELCTNCHHLTGMEAIRQRHLQLLGYQLAQLPYYELQQLKSKKEWHEYLHMKIFPTSPRLQW
ncbi:FAST kinase domain-containing protein 3, mitochondrial-like [Glandiceps talaboti]